MSQRFDSAMLDRGWHYADLDQLCDEHLRLLIESYRILHLCDQFRALMTRTLNALGRERARAHQAPRHLPWDLTRGYPLPADLC